MPKEVEFNVITKHPVRHNGELHPAATKLNLSPKDVTALASSGFVEPVEPPEEEDGKKDKGGK